MRMFMEQFCKDSPMYDYVEQIANRTPNHSEKTLSNQQPKQSKV